MFKKIYVEITNNCNLNCRFCPQTKREKKFMNLDKFEYIIRSIKNYTNLICLHVKGEPLLHPDLEEILTILDKHNMKVNITTNGVLLGVKLDDLKNHVSLRQLNISLHSVNQNNGFGSDYFQKIFSTIEELNNVIISFRIWNLQNVGSNNLNKNIIGELENYYKIYDLEEILKSNFFVKVRDNIFINQDLEFVWPKLGGEKINKNGRCMALKEQIAILVDGSVVPCCLDNDGDILLGNIFEETIDDILNKDISNKIKSNFENNIITCDLCKTCGFLKRLESKRKK